MVKAVIFDCFGVLATEAWVPFRDKYLSGNAEKLHQANMFLRQLTTGSMTEEVFWPLLAKLAGVPPGAARQSIYANIPNEPLLEYVQMLKPSVKVAILSNAGKNRLQTIFTPEQLALFDACVVSSEIGQVKPDPAAYNYAVKLLAIEPQECVFVDDQPRFVDGARAVGMQAIVYEDLARFRRELEPLLADS